ncbi:hypothetical protein SEVIR_6G132600v4 [Setaria viridis]
MDRRRHKFAKVQWQQPRPTRWSSDGSPCRRRFGFHIGGAVPIQGPLCCLRTSSQQQLIYEWTCPSKCTINSLMHRWEIIQKYVNKFCGCLIRIELRRQRGTTLQDKVAEACALYKFEDKHQKAVQFMHCWNKLRTQPK